MEISCNTEELLLSIQAFHKEAVERLERMTRRFAYRISQDAINNTPLGDSKRFFKYYQQRTFLPKEEGLARGNWQYDTDGNFSLKLVSGQDSGNQALASIASSSSSYKLGQTFYIGNSTPYIIALEKGYSPKASGGILKPTVNDIQNLFSFDYAGAYKL